MSVQQAIVYSAAGCQDCEKVKQLLTAEGVTYEVQDVMKNVAAREAVEKLGFLGIPVTVIGSQAVKGFQPDEIKKMLAANNG